jgi:hypothetical protein
MLITVVEPGYFLSLAECAKASHADLVIWANSFHMRRHSTINRAAIKTVIGRQWLTIPVISKGSQEHTILDTQINNQLEWGRTHIKTLEINYRQSAYYDYYIDRLERLEQSAYHRLDVVLQASYRFLQDELGLAGLTESKALPAVAERTTRILEWMKALQADGYLLWPHELALIDVKRLQAEKINIHTMQFSAPEYHQPFNGFVPSLSTLDLLLNEGLASRDLLQRAGHVLQVG